MTPSPVLVWAGHQHRASAKVVLARRTTARWASGEGHVYL